MGNTGSNSSNRRRRRHGGGSSSEVDHHTTDGHLQQPQPETTYPYIYAAAYTSKYPSPPYFQYQIGSCYLPPPLPAVPLWVPHDEPYYQMARERALEALGDRRYLCTAVIKAPLTYINHQKADTIKYDVNVKKETLKIEADEENPGKFLVSFTFDATVSCSFTLYLFSKEGSEDCNLTTTEEDSLPPFTVSFQEGLAQKFRQKPGTGVHLSRFEAGELRKGNQTSVYRLVVVAEATPENRDPDSGVSNAQITDAVFKNDKGEFRVTAVKQILWVNGTRYELQEIYGTGNSVDGGDNDGNIDSGKECVICLSEPRDTTALPCRHMCMCNGCAQVLRFQTNQCPICRQPVERLLEIKVNGGVDD